VNRELKNFLEAEILPRYDHFDKAHQRGHAEMVIRQSVELAEHVGADVDMAYTIAAYHDTGLTEGRDIHHLASARIVRADSRLRQWFSEEQIELMAEAVEDHRASSTHPPRSLYGRIVADADRYIEPLDIIRRTIQFGLDHYPTLDREEHYRRTLQHLREKYGRGGYLHLWMTEELGEDSQLGNAGRLEQLRCIIDDEKQVRHYFDKIWNETTEQK
jgi:uncharacterized protein